MGFPYLSLDHVDTPGTEGLHTVVNVHDTLTLRHVQHHIQDDIAACAASARAGDRKAQHTLELLEGSIGPRRSGEEDHTPVHIYTTQRTGTQKGDPAGRSQ